jgi:phospholipid/cholesterol/gamma-HCH transport system substrate-binding protein
MLLSEENLALVTQNLNQLLSMLSQLSNHNDAITRSIEDLGATLHNTRQASENLPGLTNKLSTTADSLNRMAKEISQTAVSMRETVSSGGDDIRQLTLKTMPGLQSMIEELRRAAENFRQFSEQLERNPQILLYGQSPARPGPGE